MSNKIKLQVNGIEIAARVEGEGPAVLLLHGFPDSSRLWRNQIPALVHNGYRAIAPDLRGYGDSSRPDGVENYSLIHVLGDLTALLDELDVERAHLVGHDWGAGTAWVFASFVPERTLSLTALSVGHPSFFGRAGVEQLQRSWYMFMFQFEGVAEEWLSRNDWSFVRQWMEGAVDIDEYVEELSRPGALTAALNWYRANVPPESWIAERPELPPVKAPTLGIWSSNDFALSEAQMVESHRFVENQWRYERIEDVGHWIPTEAPERLNELLLGFLRTSS